MTGAFLCPNSKIIYLYVMLFDTKKNIDDNISIIRY